MRRVKLQSLIVKALPRRSATTAWLQRHRTVVLFLLGLLILDLTVGRFHGLWQRHSPDDYAGRVQSCAERRRDYVLVGGSPVAEGLNPAIVGTNGFNLGMPGGTTSDFYHAVIHACPAPPRLLVYGITASDINDGRAEPHGPHSLMTWGDLAGWVRTRPETSEWAVRHFLRGKLERVSSLFHYRHAIRMWAAIEAETQWPGSCPETLKEALEEQNYAAGLVTGDGYSPRGGFEHARFTDHKAIGTKGTRFDHLHYLHKYGTGSHLKYLHKLVDWCCENGVELVLVDMPVTADLERMYAKEFAEFRTRLAEAERDRGLRVLRPTREELGLTDDQFADLIHMNRDGANRLSAWLKPRLPQ